MTPRLRSGVTTGLCARHPRPRQLYSCKDVDARHKPGHDKFAAQPLAQADAIAARSIGSSMMGKLMIAETTPSATDSHQTTSYEPVLVNRIPPSQTPRKPPT